MSCWTSLHLRVLAVFALVATSPNSQAAELRLAKVFGDHMVVQRELPIQVWGWADAGEKVAVSLAGHEAAALAGADGKWMATLPALEAGGPHTMREELKVPVGIVTSAEGGTSIDCWMSREKLRSGPETSHSLQLWEKMKPTIAPEESQYLE